MMKKKPLKSILIACIAMLVTPQIFAQATQIESKMYKWDNLEAVQTKQGVKRSIAKGTAVDLTKLEINAWTIYAGKKFKPVKSNETEHLIIVKEGTLNLTVDGKSSSLTPGSISLLMPNEKAGIVNSTNSPTTFYLMSYTGKTPDVTRIDSVGGSFSKVWEDIEYKPHGKGGIRNYYKRPTVMTGYSEMHVTNLNSRIKSHEPHTHRAAEIVLMIKGNTQMQIEDTFYQGTAGDLYYLGSNLSHAIENTGNEQCQYFAFQWQ